MIRRYITVKFWIFLSKIRIYFLKLCLPVHFDDRKARFCSAFGSTDDFFEAARASLPRKYPLRSQSALPQFAFGGYPASLRHDQLAVLYRPRRQAEGIARYQPEFGVVPQVDMNDP